MAIYGLFVMYKATHDLLHEWKTTGKFIAIKVVILLSILQEKVIKMLIYKFRRKDNTCLVDPADPEDLDHVVTYWSQFALLLDTILMVCLLSRAFDPEEVQDLQQQHLDLVELELQQMKVEGGNLKTESDSDDDSD
mmetsp:Transcript_25350/g.45911  ORF Transcript_25350/g.45911 Transcript_25350/m.45911 type:complete len:136 (+) Transcript_25350:743-1150(+)